MIRNIIFDWCGTLVNDLEAVWKATNQTFQKSGVEALSLETVPLAFPPTGLAWTGVGEAHDHDDTGEDHDHDH